MVMAMVLIAHMGPGSRLGPAPLAPAAIGLLLVCTAASLAAAALLTAKIPKGW